MMGATIQAGPTLHRLFAPITHLLPFIECIAGEERTLDSAELEIFSCNSGLRQLKDISPLFDRIWTGEPDVRSFAVVSPTSGDSDRLLRSRISFSIPLMTRWAGISSFSVLVPNGSQL